MEGQETEQKSGMALEIWQEAGKFDDKIASCHHCEHVFTN